MTRYGSSSALIINQSNNSAQKQHQSLCKQEESCKWELCPPHQDWGNDGGFSWLEEKKEERKDNTKSWSSLIIQQKGYSLYKKCWMTVMHQQWLKHKWTICCINSQIPKCLTTTNISNLITKLKMSVFCSASELLFLGNNSVCWMYFFFYIKKIYF